MATSAARAGSRVSECCTAAVRDGAAHTPTKGRKCECVTRWLWRLAKCTARNGGCSVCALRCVVVVDSRLHVHVERETR
jgi:hypothetical protein